MEAILGVGIARYLGGGDFGRRLLQPNVNSGGHAVHESACGSFSDGFAARVIANGFQNLLLQSAPGGGPEREVVAHRAMGAWYYLSIA
jgi:hypothetical protein